MNDHFGSTVDIMESRAIEAAAVQLRDAVATMSGTEFRRLDIRL
jgi:hypothetical protein